MPDGIDRLNGALPPTFVGPDGLRPTLLQDQHGVFLVDADGNYIGVDGNWGRGGPLARLLYAQRSQTRDL